MARSVFKETFFLLILFSSQFAVAEQLVREFTGTRSSETLQFEVKGPWLLDWWVGTDYPGQMGMDISLIAAGTGAFQGEVLKTKWPGNGVRLFQESGKFQFKVISHLGNWKLKVKQLTRQEAQQYTPKVRK